MACGCARKDDAALRQQLLARTRRSLDQHRRHARRHQADAAADFEHAGGVADQFRQSLGDGRFAPGRIVGRRRAGHENRAAGRRRLARNQPVLSALAGRTEAGGLRASPTCLSAMSGAAFQAAVSASWLGAEHKRAPGGKGCAGHRRRLTVGVDQVHIRKAEPKLADKFGQVEIGQPRVDDYGLGRGALGLGPRCCPALGLAHLPAKPGERGAEPLPEVGIGAGENSRARTAAQRRSGR